MGCPKGCQISAYYTVFLFTLTRFTSITGIPDPWPPSLPIGLQSLDIANRLRNDPATIAVASTDYGHMVQKIPAAVLEPQSVDDIAFLIRYSFYNSSVPFSIAPRGRGHSVQGQETAFNGVVVNMTLLNNSTTRINISQSASLGYYADVGAEQMWIDVLQATLKEGLAPVSWTDYLYLTVGGTLSNAGISGQTFRYGPQISNVYELDVITGKGDIVTCSELKDRILFYAVLGGLGQFGIITRARIPLEPAPMRVKVVRMIYDNFSNFTRDQEHLIKGINGLNYLEGFLMMQQNKDTWASLFPPSALPKLVDLVKKNGIIYFIQAVMYYDNPSIVKKELEVLLQGLNFLPGFNFTTDASFLEFLNRVHFEELALRALGLWDIPHPWLNLFIPKAHASDFDSGVFRNIILKSNLTLGITIFYPMIRNRWDARMSAIITEDGDDIFYTLGLLQATPTNWEVLENQNKEILQFCEKAGLNVKQYLGHHATQREWMKHFGYKWPLIQQRKSKFDPKKILAPGQAIFNAA